VNHLPSQSRWDYGPKTSRQCSKDYFVKLIARHQKLAKDDDYYWFGVFEKKSGCLIGSIDFDVFLRSTHQFANFGYVIYNRYWGLGYGQEAAALGLKIGFKQLKLNRLEAAINLDNRKSIRLAKAIGMKREGIKKRYWFENGEWVDHLIYVANPEDLGLKAPKPF
jgi:RimJ/RimL family protein N-acetyltransferase